MQLVPVPSHMTAKQSCCTAHASFFAFALVGGLGRRWLVSFFLSLCLPAQLSHMVVLPPTVPS